MNLGSAMALQHKMLFLIFLSLLSGSPVLAKELERVHAQQGELSLRGWTKTNQLTLTGEWFFFPNEHVSPQNFVERWRINPQSLMTVTVGQRFRDLAPTFYRDDFGTGTYALVLHDVPEGQLALTGISVYTSGRLHVFACDDPVGTLGQLNIGQPGSTRESTLPLTATDSLLPFRVGSASETVILIHVSNFHHDWGGLWVPPQIGDFLTLSHALQARDKLNYWLIGLIFFLAVYNFSLYVRRPEDRASLFLGYFSLGVFLRLVVLAESASHLLPDSVWKYELSFKVIYASMVVPPILFLYFLKSCFPDRIRMMWIKVLSIVVLLPVLVVIFTPATVYGHLSNPLKILGLVVALVCLMGLIKAVLARDEGAAISLGGSLFILLGFVLDLLNSYGLDFLPTNSIGMGMSAFIICQSQIVASRFASAFRRSEHLSRELQSEVEKQTRDIKSILMHIRQGIFTISNADTKIDELYSEYLKELTQQPHIHGQNLRSLILDRSYLNEETKALTESSLYAALDEHVINFEVNAANLVRELEFAPLGSHEKKRVFELDWNPMLRKDETVEKVLVSIRDVTELRTLEAQARKQEEDMKVIMDLIRIPEDRFHRFIYKTMEYLQENRELIQQTRDGKTDVVKRLFVNMHTIKGASRTYYLGAISSASHEVEQYYAAIQKQLAPWDQKRLLEDLSRVEAAVEHYRNVSESRLGWQSSNKAVKMSRKEIEYTLEMLGHLEHMNLTGKEREALKEAERVLLETCYTELPGVIDESCQGIDSMARDLGKAKPNIELAVSRVVLKDKGADLLHSLLTHLLRNSMDHGIERPEIRMQRGKLPQGTIRMWTEIIEPYLYFHYQDDGNGLNLVKLEQIGKKRGLLPPRDCHADQDIAELIFRSGLSTKDEVSEISGRGVGLDAVRSYIEEQGGSIQVVLHSVADREHVPFTLIINLPLNLCFLAKTLSLRPVDVAG